MLTTSSFGLSSAIPVGDTLRQTGTYCSCKRLWSMKIYLSICIKLDIALFFISGLSEVAARDKWKMELNSKSVRKEKSDSIVEYRKSMKHSCNCSKVNVLEFFLHMFEDVVLQGPGTSQRFAGSRCWIGGRLNLQAKLRPMHGHQYTL